MHHGVSPLLIQIGLSVIPLALSQVRGSGEYAAFLFKQLFLPLADLARIHLAVAS